MTAIPGLSDETWTEKQSRPIVEVRDRVAVPSVQERRTGVVLVDAAPVLDRPGSAKNQARRQQSWADSVDRPGCPPSLLPETLGEADLIARPANVRDVRGLRIQCAALGALAPKAVAENARNASTATGSANNATLSLLRMCVSPTRRYPKDVLHLTNQTQL